VTIDLTVQGFASDKSATTVPAGASVTINFTNEDTGVAHNFALYDSSSKELYQGDIIDGPDRRTYQFTAPGTPGPYTFRCDLHPVQMKGSFIVTP